MIFRLEYDVISCKMLSLGLWVTSSISIQMSRVIYWFKVLQLNQTIPCSNTLGAWPVEPNFVTKLSLWPFFVTFIWCGDSLFRKDPKLATGKPHSRQNTFSWQRLLYCQLPLCPIYPKTATILVWYSFWAW